MENAGRIILVSRQEMNLDPASGACRVELAMDISVQPGLSFKVWLDFQNGDELTLSASHF